MNELMIPGERQVQAAKEMWKRGLSPISHYCREPMSRKKRPRRTRMRSMTLLLRFFSWKRRAPQRKLTITLERRIMETIDTMEALEARDTK